MAHEALDEARALGLHDVEVDLLISLAVAEGARGDPAEAIAHLEEVQRRAEQVDDPAAATRARYNLALALIDVGEIDHALRVLERLLADASAAGVGLSPYAIEARRVMASTRYVAGDWDGVLADVARGHRELPAPLARSLDAGALPVLAARDPAAAVAATDDEAARNFWMPDAGHFVAGARVEALAWLGDHPAVVSVVEETLDWFRAAGEPWHLGGIWLSAVAVGALADCAERAALARRRDRARAGQEGGRGLPGGCADPRRAGEATAVGAGTGRPGLAGPGRGRGTAAGRDGPGLGLGGGHRRVRVRPPLRGGTLAVAVGRGAGGRRRPCGGGAAAGGRAAGGDPVGCPAPA